MTAARKASGAALRKAMPEAVHAGKRQLHAKHDAGVTAGSDWPVVPNPDPWNGMEGMITRRNPSGEFGDATLWPEQALDLAPVLEIYTINGAQLGDVTGSIEIGKSADLIVLDRNLFDTPADEIADTKVLTTYFEGRPVHERS